MESNIQSTGSPEETYHGVKIFDRIQHDLQVAGGTIKKIAWVVLAVSLGLGAFVLAIRPELSRLVFIIASTCFLLTSWLMARLIYNRTTRSQV
ncbi:hypothetical protein [uncultured Methanolobus sp.]|uniref:hypothetical protein n=1 Tax=uncultured Methanolobus sp. TaxID=218300 RepID=UPI002AAA97B1|nr:hypothetical protein [uncultured Methanolobus sp.]